MHGKQEQIQTYSTYRDASGQSWNIKELLNSAVPRLLIEIPVPILWQRHASKVVWSATCGSLANVMTSQNPMLLQALEWDWSELSPKITFDDKPVSHIYRIAAMIKSLGNGWVPEPLIYGLDGSLWDGHHRLCALHFVGQATHKVFDFSHRTDQKLSS